MLSPNWVIDTSLSYSQSNIDLQLAVLNASYVSPQYTGTVNLHGQYEVLSVYARPKLSVSYSHIISNAYDLQGTLFEGRFFERDVKVHLPKTESNLGYAEASTEFSRMFSFSNGTQIMPYTELGVHHEFERPNAGQILTGDFLFANFRPLDRLGEIGRAHVDLQFAPARSRRRLSQPRSARARRVGKQVPPIVWLLAGKQRWIASLASHHIRAGANPLKETGIETSRCEASLNSTFPGVVVCARSLTAMASVRSPSARHRSLTHHLNGATKAGALGSNTNFTPVCSQTFGGTWKKILSGPDLAGRPIVIWPTGCPWIIWW